MTLILTNEVIERMDIVREDEEFFLKIKTKTSNNDIFLEIEFVQLMLKLLSKKTLTSVKNVPVRIVGEDQGDDTMLIMAFGNLIEDEWVNIDFGESEIISFEKLLEVNDISEAEIAVRI